jgi:deoxyribodipyrimidine photolyase-like uncharacterized protein
MNKTLIALMTKLKWQINEVEKQLQTIEHEINSFDLQLHDIQQKIINASKTSKYILPEREIAGLHFIISQQTLQEELKQKLTEHNFQHKTMNSKKIRLETELKMLEKHQNNQLKMEEKSALLIEQNTIDEWIIQRKNNEN